MTYYKYVKRDLDDQVNWADLSKQLTEKLNQEVKVREEKKAQFDKEFRDLNNKIAEKPIGTSAAANKMALRIGDAAAQQNLMLYKKLKAGEIRPRDYVMLRQNINDSVDSYYNSLKQWQEVSKTKMDRNSKGDSSGFELKKMAELESYGDFDNVSPIFTDEGRLVLAKQTTDPDTGEVKMGEVKPIDQILVDMNSYYDKFPVNEVMDKWVESLGKYGKYVKDADGNIKLIVDANQRPIFEKASNDQIEAFVNSDPYNTLSILEDSIGFIDGKDIEYTYDKNKAGGNVILLERNPNDPNKRDIPRLDDNQRKVVIDWAKNQLQTKLEYSESGLIKKEEPKPPAEPKAAAPKPAAKPRPAAAKKEKEPELPYLSLLAGIENAINPQDADITAENFNNLFKQSGYTFDYREETGPLGNLDKLIIIDPDGKELGRFDVDNKSQAEAIKGVIYADLERRFGKKKTEEGGVEPSGEEENAGPLSKYNKPQ